MTQAQDFNQLTGQFLIAMPGLAGPYFTRSVVLVCSHSAEGSLGLVVNHPSDTSLAELMEQLDQPPPQNAMANEPVMVGGPVEEDKGFILHPPLDDADPDHSMSVSPDFQMTSSLALLHRIARGEGPQEHLVLLGFAGWAPGQLQQEIRNNFWLTAPASADVVFHTPIAQRWEAAARLAGVDIRSIYPDSGHA